MKHNTILGLFLLAVASAVAWTLPNGTQVRRGSGAPTNSAIVAGEFGFDPSAQRLYIGTDGTQSVCIGVAEPASTGYVGTAISALASTNYVYDTVTNAVSGVTTNLTLWDGSTNVVLAITNGLIKAISTP